MLEVEFITDAEQKKLVAIAKDRNLTVHMYNEDFAEDMSFRVEDYYNFMYTLVAKIEQELM